MFDKFKKVRSKLITMDYLLSKITFMLDISLFWPTTFKFNNYFQSPKNNEESNLFTKICNRTEKSIALKLYLSKRYLKWSSFDKYLILYFDLQAHKLYLF